MYQVSVPEGTSGDWLVERFTVTKQDARWYNINCHGRPIDPGNYTKLMCRGWVVMSDTPLEIRDHLEMIYRAKGHILINGLGLGVVLQACLNKPEVIDAIVVEISKDVIRLVAEHYQKMFGPRLTVVHDDAFTYEPPKGLRFSAVWNDIWNNICDDNLPEMHKLHRRYGRRTDWQGSWSYRQR